MSEDEEKFTMFDKVKSVVAFAVIAGVSFWFAWSAMFDPSFAEEVAGGSLHGSARARGLGAAVQAVVGVIGPGGTAVVASLLGLGSTALMIRIARAPVDP